MGEYVRYKGKEVKIGTLESLHYASFEKYTNALGSGKLTRSKEGVEPGEDAKSDAGFLFRFPFPDEDGLTFGEIIEPYDRGIPIRVPSNFTPVGTEKTAFETVYLVVRLKSRLQVLKAKGRERDYNHK